MGAASQNLRRKSASFRMRRRLAFCAAIFAWDAAMIDRCGSPRDPDSLRCVPSFYGSHAEQRTTTALE